MKNLPSFNTIVVYLFITQSFICRCRVEQQINQKEFFQLGTTCLQTIERKRVIISDSTFIMTAKLTHICNYFYKKGKQVREHIFSTAGLLWQVKKNHRTRTNCRLLQFEIEISPEQFSILLLFIIRDRRKKFLLVSFLEVTEKISVFLSNYRMHSWNYARSKKNCVAESVTCESCSHSISRFPKLPLVSLFTN